MRKTAKIRIIKQALAEAQKRYGVQRAIVRGPSKCFRGVDAKAKNEKEKNRYVDRCSGMWYGHAKDCPGDKPYYTVGRLTLGFFEIRGEGPTWEAAFAAAAWRDHEFCMKCDNKAKRWCPEGKQLREAAGLVVEAQP